MSGKALTPMQLAERTVGVLKSIEDLDPAQQREVLEHAIATCDRLGEKKS